MATANAIKKWPQRIKSIILIPYKLLFKLLNARWLQNAIELFIQKYAILK